jgi:hypothetical protein
VTASRRLRRKIELVLGEYASPGRLLLADPDAAAVYPRFLERLFFLPLTAVPLMKSALRRARELSAGGVARVHVGHRRFPPAA